MRAISILLHSFQWKTNGESVLLQYKINMNSGCLKYVNVADVVIQLILF